MDKQVLNTEKTNDKYYKIPEINRTFAGTIVNGQIAGAAGAIKLTDNNGNIVYAGTYSGNLNNIYESAISLNNNKLTRGADEITFANNNNNINISSAEKKKSSSEFPSKIKNNSITTIIVDPNTKNSNIVSFTTTNGGHLFSEKTNGIDGIVFDTTGHIPKYAIGVDKDTGKCFLIINADKIYPNPDTGDIWSLKELQKLTAEFAADSNIFKKLIFKLSGDEEKILNAINQVKTYADSFNYYTPKLKHDKNFNISLVIRRSI